MQTRPLKFIFFFMRTLKRRSNNDHTHLYLSNYTHTKWAANFDSSIPGVQKQILPEMKVKVFWLKSGFWLADASLKAERWLVSGLWKHGGNRKLLRLTGSPTTGHEVSEVPAEGGGCQLGVDNGVGGSYRCDQKASRWGRTSPIKFYSRQTKYKSKSPKWAESYCCFWVGAMRLGA